MQDSICSLPEAFKDQMKSLLGEADFFKYLSVMKMPALKGLRMNALKNTDEQGPEQWFIESDPVSLRPVQWAKDGYYYEAPFRPGQSPLHEAGLFYIQEPSAMSAVTLLDPGAGECILDLCAAPGGKSTQIASYLSGRGLLVSNEPNMSRCRTLSSNIERMGIRNSVVTCEKPERLSAIFPSFFNRILVDAPCSGEGMFRKNPESMAEWHPGSLAQCAARQIQILDQAALMLKPGGTLVYSTCTFNQVENEQVIGQFLETHKDFSAVSFALPGLPEAPSGMLHLYPHEIEGEGHFLAKLVRRASASDEAPAPVRKNKNRARKITNPDIPDFYRSLSLRQERLYDDGRMIWLLPDMIEREQLEQIHYLRAGLSLWNAQGHPEPDHAAGMALKAEEVPAVCPLTFKEMVEYQAGETIRRSCEKGWILMQYKGLSLGWGKQSDGIIKNHYPRGLRRRS